MNTEAAHRPAQAAVRRPSSPRPITVRPPSRPGARQGHRHGRRHVVDPPGLWDVARWGLPTLHDGQPGRDVRVVGMAAVLPAPRQGSRHARGCAR